VKKLHIEIRPTPGTLAALALGIAFWICVGIAFAGGASLWLPVAIFVAAHVIGIANGDDVLVEIR
jgi:hypothetical protein